LTWVFLALGSAVFLGFYEIAKKKSLEANAVWPVLFLVSFFCALLLAPYRLTQELAPLTNIQHLALMAKALLVSLSWAATYQALRHLPMTVASPVRASAPLFTLLAAVFVLQENPTLAQWMGIAVTLLAYWIFALGGRKEPIALHRNPWVGLMLVGTVLGAASGIYDKYLLQNLRIEPLSVQWYFTLYMMLIQGLWVVIWWKRGMPGTPFRFTWGIALVALFLLIADQFYFHSLAQPDALISVVSVIRRSNVAVSFALGILLLGEKKKKHRILAVILILIGLALMTK